MSRPARTVHGDYGFARQNYCRCQPCLDAVHRYAKRLSIDHARGVRRRVDAAPVRAHLEYLVEAGVSGRQIAAAAGVRDTQVRNLLHGNPRTGPVEYMLRPTAQALLAVRYEECVVVNALVCSVSSVRRVRALQYMGHTVEDVAARIGIENSAVYYWLKNPDAPIQQDNVNALRPVYDELSMRDGGNVRTRWHAYRQGYPPPMAWDEITIEDPDAEPAWHHVVCIVDKCLRRVSQQSLCGPHWTEADNRRAFETGRRYKVVVERLSTRAYDNEGLIEALSNLKELGYTPEAAAKRLGRGVAYVEKIWSKAS